MDNMLPLLLNPHADFGFGRDRPLYRMARSGVSKSGRSTTHYQNTPKQLNRNLSEHVDFGIRQ